MGVLEVWLSYGTIKHKTKGAKSLWHCVLTNKKVTLTDNRRKTSLLIWSASLELVPWSTCVNYKSLIRFKKYVYLQNINQSNKRKKVISRYYFCIYFMIIGTKCNLRASSSSYNFVRSSVCTSMRDQTSVCTSIRVRTSVRPL